MKSLLLILPFLASTICLAQVNITNLTGTDDRDAFELKLRTDPRYADWGNTNCFNCKKPMLRSTYGWCPKCRGKEGTIIAYSDATDFAGTNITTSGSSLAWIHNETNLYVSVETATVYWGGLYDPIKLIVLTISTNLATNWVTIGEFHKPVGDILQQQIGSITTNRLLTVIHSNRTNTLILDQIGREEWPSLKRILTVPARKRP